MKRAAALLAVSAILFAALCLVWPQAAHSAAGGDVFYGHRCRTYPVEKTVENTPTAMKAAAKAGAGCEIDVWALEGGRCFIVWHDNLWEWKADPTTLRGVPAHVKDTTCEQARQVRSRGGARVARWSTMMKTAHRLDVPVLVESKNGLPTTILDRLYGADVIFYQSPSPGNCQLRALDALDSAGAYVGVKTSAECPRSPEWYAAHGASFVVDNLDHLTADNGALVEEYAALGMWSMGKCVARPGWVRERQVGITHHIVNHPAQATDWELAA